MLFQMLSTLLMSRLRGDHKRSPFFDPDTGAPCVTPRVLSTEELQKVEAARDAN
jgi:hypothetical protein